VIPNISESLILILLGLFAGSCGGLLGIGGSLIIIPGLVMLHGPSQQHLYQAAAMIVNFFVALPATWQHTRAGATLRPITRWMVPSAVLGSVGGVMLSDLPIFRGAGQGWLQISFAGFLLYVILYNLQRIGSSRRLPTMDESGAAKLSKGLIVMLVGLPMGLLGGVLGVGGGLLAVPLQQVVLRVPLTAAIANSAGTILWSSIVGAAVKNWSLSVHGHTFAQSATLALLLIPPAMVGSYITSRKVHQWPVKVIRLALVMLLGYAAYKLAMAGWGQVGSEPRL
jgi:uncharacterized membrane protein YfcA